MYCIVVTCHNAMTEGWQLTRWYSFLNFFVGRSDPVVHNNRSCCALMIIKTWFFDSCKAFHHMKFSTLIPKTSSEVALCVSILCYFFLVQQHLLAPFQFLETFILNTVETDVSKSVIWAEKILNKAAVSSSSSFCT